MGTHPIFESDFDCLTDKMGISKAVVKALGGFWKALKESKKLKEASQKEKSEADQRRLLEELKQEHKEAQQKLLEETEKRINDLKDKFGMTHNELSVVKREFKMFVTMKNYEA